MKVNVHTGASYQYLKLPISFNYMQPLTYKYTRNTWLTLKINFNVWFSFKNVQLHVFNYMIIDNKLHSLSIAESLYFTHKSNIVGTNSILWKRFKRKKKISFTCLKPTTVIILLHITNMDFILCYVLMIIPCLHGTWFVLMIFS